MGKKGVTMSLFEANSKFGGDAASQMLPSQSEGKDFGKSKGKGLRDNTGDLDDWRTPGERKGKGRGKGDERSRADDGDWFAKDRPAGGDRGGGGGGGFRRDDRRDDNTQANKDDDWRSGMGSRGGGGGGGDDDRGDRRGFGGGGGGGRGGFGNRDRDSGRDDELSNWRREKQDSSGPSERPKLNLKPRSGGADATPAGGDKPSHPWAKKDGEEDDDATPAAEEKKPTKYVPPAQRKAMEEEDKKKELRRKEDEERRAKNAERMQKEEEEKDRRRQEAQRKQDELAEKRRKEQEEVEEKKRRIEEEKQAAERARKNELKLQKEAEAKERREAIMRASQEKKNAAKGGSVEAKVAAFDAEKVDSFCEKCEALVKGGGNVDTFVKKEVDDILTPDELGTVQPMARLLETLLMHCRGKKDKEVIDTVAKFAPLLNCLINSSGMHRFKVKVLIEAQRIASKMGLPRLSPASALLEVFFDGLYSAEVIEEAYFEMWAVCNDDTPGKTSAMFQVNFFLDWLRKAKLEGEESSEEEDEDKEGSEEEDEDDDEEVDDDDIMANVPRGRGR